MPTGTSGRLRLDKFAAEDPANGFSAFSSPADPKPAIGIAGGRVVSLDGVLEHDFDMIDRFIARHHIDPQIAPEAMAMDSATVARWLVDMNVPREKLVRLAHGMTPAKLAQVVSHLNALEIAFAYSKMRARKTPGNQAHVTNAKDDPLQLAADAATAVAFGFDEIETTMRVSRNAWSNAVACAVGGAVGRWGTLFQCSSEEAEELRIAMAGFTSYAETVSVYGTEKSFIDGDDTPWSKAFLAAAYASRGVKMRCTSGAGSELLMGFHESKSLLYLEARCLCLQRGMGVQGTQNGGIDGAPLTATIPGGVRELMAENLIAVWLDLECASGNDARSTESEIRVGAKILPFLIAGSDLICSGFGSILKYDNSFNPSLINGEELEDYLVLQRDFEADGGLTPLPEERAIELRERAVEAIAAVFEELGLSTPTEDMKASVVYASGSDDTRSCLPRDTSFISEAIKERGITRDRCHQGAGQARLPRGGREPAERREAAALRRLSPDLGDDPQRTDRQRGQRSQRLSRPRLRLSRLRGTAARAQRHPRRARPEGSAALGGPAREGRGKAHPLPQPRTGRREIGERRCGHRHQPGLRAEALSHDGQPPAFRSARRDDRRRSASAASRPRVVRFRHTADTSFLGLSAARLAGSGIGIGIQAKGTAVIHQRDRQPHNNLELFSNAPITRLEHYRALGANAAAYALGEMPEPVVVPHAGRGHGLALSCPRRAHLCHRDGADGGGRRARRGRGHADGSCKS